MNMAIGSSAIILIEFQNQWKVVNGLKLKNAVA